MSLKSLQTKLGIAADGAFGPGTMKAAMTYYKLTPIRAAHFFAQTSHESGGFTVFTENLNYSAQGLQNIFGKYFPGTLEESYARNPEKIANRVYANRMGNGPESSGDGYRYCGRGLIQLTGKSNYQDFADSIDSNINEMTEYLSTFEGAVQSACWFWENKNLNSLADINDMKTITKIINGGLNGFDDRIHWYNLAMKIYGE